MTWAKIDDRANEHRKQLEAGPEACWLWVCGLMYANRQPARDGYIPASALRMLYPFTDPEALAHRLVSARLWKKTKDGFRIHEFESWNETAEQRETRLAESRKRAAKSYENKRAAAEKSARAEQPQKEKSAREEGAQKTNSSGSLPLRSASTPGEEDPLTPKPRDRLAEQLTGTAPHQRADVRRLHEAFKKTFGFSGHVLKGYGDLNAQDLADVLDAHGEETCMRVLAHAPKDGKVSGRDDERREKHESIRYIFGTPQTFARILRAADEEAPANRESTVQRIARLKQEGAA